MKKPDRRTGSFTKHATAYPGEPTIPLVHIFRQVGLHIQKATNDNRTYTLELTITANLTVNP